MRARSPDAAEGEGGKTAMSPQPPPPTWRRHTTERRRRFSEVFSLPPSSPLLCAHTHKNHQLRATRPCPCHQAPFRIWRRPHHARRVSGSRKQEGARTTPITGRWRTRRRRRWRPPAAAWESWRSKWRHLVSDSNLDGLSAGRAPKPQASRRRIASRQDLPSLTRPPTPESNNPHHNNHIKKQRSASSTPCSRARPPPRHPPPLPRPTRTTRRSRPPPRRPRSAATPPSPTPPRPRSSPRPCTTRSTWPGC